MTTCPHEWHWLYWNRIDQACEISEIQFYSLIAYQPIGQTCVRCGAVSHNLEKGKA